MGDSHLSFLHTCLSPHSSSLSSDVSWLIVIIVHKPLLPAFALISVYYMDLSDFKHLSKLKRALQEERSGDFAVCYNRHRGTVHSLILAREDINFSFLILTPFPHLTQPQRTGSMGALFRVCQFRWIAHELLFTGQKFPSNCDVATAGDF